MSNRVSPKAESDFYLTLEYLRNDLAVWEASRADCPDDETVQEFRMYFTRQIARLKKMAKRGIVTPQSQELIRRAKECLDEM